MTATAEYRAFEDLTQALYNAQAELQFVQLQVRIGPCPDCEDCQEMLADEQAKIKALADEVAITDPDHWLLA